MSSEGARRPDPGSPRPNSPLPEQLRQPCHRPEQQHLARILRAPQPLGHYRMRQPIEVHPLDDPLVVLGQLLHGRSQPFRALPLDQLRQRLRPGPRHRIPRPDPPRAAPMPPLRRVIAVLLDDLPHRSAQEAPTHPSAIAVQRGLAVQIPQQLPTRRLHDVRWRLDLRQFRPKSTLHEGPHSRQRVAPPRRVQVIRVLQVHAGREEDRDSAPDREGTPRAASSHHQQAVAPPVHRPTALRPTRSRTSTISRSAMREVPASLHIRTL